MTRSEQHYYNEEAALQREMGGIRSDIASLQRDITAQHATLKAAIDLTAQLQRETNGRLKRAEVEIEVMKARHDERAQAYGEREHARDKRIKNIQWGVTTAVALLSVVMILVGYYVAG